MLLFANLLALAQITSLHRFRNASDTLRTLCLILKSNVKSSCEIQIESELSAFFNGFCFERNHFINFIIKIK